MPENADHPFLDDDFHVRWSRLAPGAVTRDIRLALERARARVDALCGPFEPDSLTYENTLLALEEATEELNHAWGLVSHLDSVRNSDELREAHNEMLPEVTQFFSRIPLNPDLWARIKAYSETEEARSLRGVEKRLLDETVSDFLRSGADLPPDEKARLEKVQEELARKTQKYSENVLDSTKAWDLVLEDDSRLGGLPESARELFKSEALAKGLGSEESPVYRITLKAPSYVPVLEHAEDRSLREEVWRGSVTIGRGGEWDNTGLIAEILRLRQELATLLGKDHFADQVLEKRMAKDGASARAFVEDLANRTRPFFDRDIEELAAFRREEEPDWNGEFEPWDVAYWSERMRQARYDFDDEQLRPWFAIDRVLEGMFRLTEKLFGFRIAERETVFREAGGETGSTDGNGGDRPSDGGGGSTPSAEDGGPVEVWHPEVKFYELRDEESGELLGSFYADWHPREEKRGGAWMNYLRTGSPPVDGGPRKPHLGLICGNLTPSSPNRPALLTHREVETVFHEFGHLLHHLLGEVPVDSLNGVKVVWDFVELPSQLMENFCWSRDSLDFFAVHHETGEPIPEDLFRKMTGARNFQSASAQMRQLAFAKLDLALHTERHSDSALAGDLDGTAERILEGYLFPLATRPPTMARRFTHLFASPTGYAAGYYSYKWAEVLDADAFTRFAEDGVLSEAVGREFREKVLSQGNARPAEELFREFMGRDPGLDALLERNGLVA